VIETESMEFITAIALTTGVIILVVGMLAFQLVFSGKRLRKAQRLIDAAIESSPALLTIVFDEHDQVAEFKVQNPASQEYFRQAFIGKKKQELSFLPMELLNPTNPAPDSRPASEKGKATAPLKMPEGNILYIAWQMQDYPNEAGQTEFRLARGYDITEELQQTQQKLKRLSVTSSEVEEQERKRIAEDLHDRIGEVLMTSARLLDDLKKKSSSPDVGRGLDELEGTIKKFTRETHSLIFDLVPQVLYDVGLTAAVESLAANFKKEHNLAIRIEDALQDFEINPEIAIFLYKAIKEFIRNARRHGGADEILISLFRADRTITVAVQDNGSGFAVGANPLAPSAEAGFGLFNIKNRAEYYGGGLEIADSAALGGGQIKVWASQPETLKTSN